MPSSDHVNVKGCCAKEHKHLPRLCLNLQYSKILGTHCLPGRYVTLPICTTAAGIHQGNKPQNLAGEQEDVSLCVDRILHAKHKEIDVCIFL